MKFGFAVDEKQVKHLLYVYLILKIFSPYSSPPLILSLRFHRGFWGAAAKTAKEMSDNLISHEEFGRQ